jgi:hypothetical protein
MHRAAQSAAPSARRFPARFPGDAMRDRLRVRLVRRTGGRFDGGRPAGARVVIETSRGRSKTGSGAIPDAPLAAL